MARNDGVDRTVARNRDLKKSDTIKGAQAHNERQKESYSIGPLKASCGTSQAITTTAARTALSPSAGAAAATDPIARIGTASTPSVPTPQAA